MATQTRLSKLWIRIRRNRHVFLPALSVLVLIALYQNCGVPQMSRFSQSSIPATSPSVTATATPTNQGFHSSVDAQAMYNSFSGPEVSISFGSAAVYGGSTLQKGIGMPDSGNAKICRKTLVVSPGAVPKFKCYQEVSYGYAARDALNAILSNPGAGSMQQIYSDGQATSYGGWLTYEISVDQIPPLFCQKWVWAANAANPGTGLQYLGYYCYRQM